MPATAFSARNNPGSMIWLYLLSALPLALFILFLLFFSQLLLLLLLLLLFLS